MVAGTRCCSPTLPSLEKGEAGQSLVSQEKDVSKCVGWDNQPAPSWAWRKERRGKGERAKEGVKIEKLGGRDRRWGSPGFCSWFSQQVPRTLAFL